MSESPPTADLHLHTTASDGILTVGDLPTAADAAGLNLIAVTDHDVIHPKIPAPVVALDSLTVVRGVELRVETPTEQIDLLGYAVSRTDALETELDRIQQNRIDRGAEIIESVESYLDIDLDIEPRTGLGRPHIARAIDASDAPYDVERAFDELIGNNGPCFVPRAVTLFEAGVELLTEACAVVSLAHPFRYEDPAAALELTSALDGVERYYPYGFAVDTGRVDALIEAHGLLATGGSDAHGETLGHAGLSGAKADTFRSALPKAERYTRLGA